MDRLTGVMTESGLRAMLTARGLSPDRLRVEHRADATLLILQPVVPGAIPLSLRCESGGVLLSVADSDVLEFADDDERDQRELLAVVAAALDGSLDVFETTARNGSTVVTRIRAGELELLISIGIGS
jgi:hypothetical protein